MNLLICADPGARSHTLASWLLNTLTDAVFEPGIVFKDKFVKKHTDFDNTVVKNHSGPKIRIRPTYSKLAVHLYLFLIKNVYLQIPDFSRNQYDLETVTKVTEVAKYWFYHDQQINNDLYDYVINFEDTYNIEKMTKLYYQIWNKNPNTDLVKVLEKTNDLNNPTLDKNHACNIATMVLEKEHRLKFKEEERFWSMPDLYQITSPTDLYETIASCIISKNYGIDLNKL